ncbi:MAG: hypothetical protein WCG02_01405 [Candidatus Taylorbacteria bacterium]
MIKSRTSNRGGILKLTVYIILVLIVLAYLGLNLRGIVASTTFQDNWELISGIAQKIWDKYLSGAAEFLWTKVVLPLINLIPKK